MRWYYSRFHKSSKHLYLAILAHVSIHICMGESSKLPKSWTLEIQILKLSECLQNWIISSLNDKLSLDYPKTNQRNYYNLPNSAFWGWLSLENRPQNPEFRNNPENFHPYICQWSILIFEYVNLKLVSVSQFWSNFIESISGTRKGCIRFLGWSDWNWLPWQPKASIDL